MILSWPGQASIANTPGFGYSRWQNELELFEDDRTGYLLPMWLQVPATEQGGPFVKFPEKRGPRPAQLIIRTVSQAHSAVRELSGTDTRMETRASW